MGYREAEPVAVPDGQPGGLGGLGAGEAVAHPERLEDVALDVVAVALARGALDHEPEQDVVGVGVLEPRSGRRRQLRAVELADGVLERAVADRAEQPSAGQAGNAARLVQQLANGDALLRAGDEP